MPKGRSNWLEEKTKSAEGRGSNIHNSEIENMLLMEAQDRFSTAREGKVDFDGKPLHDKWKRYDQIYRGQQWFESVSPDRSTPVLNFTQSLIHSLVPRLTENQPEAVLRPRTSPEDMVLGEGLTSVVGHLWYTNRMQEETLREAVLHILKYGTAIFKVVWNPEMWDGLGEVEYSCVHPVNFFNDPRAYKLKDMEYCFTRTPKSLEYFIRRWPDKGHLVIPDNDWVEVESLQGRDDDHGVERATLTEYWFRDSNGNVSVMYYSGSIVLGIIGGQYESNKEFRDRPVYLHNRFPFARMCDYDIDKEFWGMGEIELCDVVQRLINAYEAQIIDNTRLMGNAQWVVNKALSGLDETDAWVFDNQPGNVIFTHNGGVDRSPGVPIPHHIPDHLERLVFWLEQITGVYDVMQGRRPVGVRAASAIIALQESANIRVREKAANMGAAIREMTEQAIWMVLENYEEPRVIRIAGQMTPVTLNVREALEQRIIDMADASGALPEESYTPDGIQVQPEVMEEMMQEIKFPEFDVEIKVGSSVPYSQALLYEQAKEFYQLGIIDRRAVLEATGFPGRDEILARIEGQEQGMEGEEEERAGERTF